MPRKADIINMSMSAERDGASLATMSNYSVYFLSQSSNISINCSVYSLTHGSIRWQDYYSLNWSSNITNFLPAYYVTNCSIPDLLDQIEEQYISSDDISSWLTDYYKNPYNVSDNGDSFVALSYVLVGSCVSCWMLMLLLILSPKHKRKPILTQLAMLVYSVFITVLFAHVADITRNEYYMDSLDMVKLLKVLVDRRHKVHSQVSDLITQLAYLQLFLKMTKHKWKRLNAGIVSVLILISLVSSCIVVSQTQSSIYYVITPYSPSDIVRLASEILFILWFAVCLAYYTLFGTATPPKQVSYSRKLFPLAILTWFLVILYIVLLLLLISVWRTEWLTNSWVILIPALLDMFILTTSWEWVYSIRHLESQLELVDMLGRRISLEHVMDFNDENVRQATFRSRFDALLEFFRGPKTENTSSDLHNSVTGSSSYSPAFIDCGRPENQGHEFSEESDRSINEIYELDTDSSEDSGSLHFYPSNTSVNGTNDAHSQKQPTEHEIYSSNSPNGENETGYTSQQLGTSSNRAEVNGTSSQGETNENPPSFIPHPGFSYEDYWDEKK